MEKTTISKRYFLFPLFLLAASGALACYDPAGSGRCGPNGIGPRNTGGYGSGSYNQQIYVPPQIYVSPPAPQAYMPPPNRESRYGAFAVYVNPNAK